MQDYSKENYITRWSLDRRKGHLYKTLMDEQRGILKDTVLMVGCNAGSTLTMLREYAPHAIGIDLNFHAIKEAAGNRVCGNVLQIPFLNKSIDTILALDFIEHIYPIDMLSLINEFHRILKPAGFMFAFSPRCDIINPSAIAMNSCHVQWFENPDVFLEPWWRAGFTGAAWNDTRHNPVDGNPHDAVVMKICRL